MAWFFSSFKRSASQLRQTRTLVLTGLLIALTVLLSMYTIRLTPTLKLGVSFVGKAAIGMFCGPVTGFLAGCVTDIAGFLLSPGNSGAYNPVFTFIEGFGGLLYGLFLFDLRLPSASAHAVKESPLRRYFSSGEAKFLFLRVLGARLAVTVLCNLVLNTWALYPLYGITPETFWPWFLPRLIKNATMFPVELVVMLLALPILKRLHHKLFRP